MNIKKILTFSLTILFISIDVTNGIPKKDKDYPKTVWEFIYQDWKKHIESQVVPLPTLYHLFVEGWAPSKKTKNKRSYPFDLKEKPTYQTWDESLKLIDDLVRNVKYNRFLENNEDLKASNEKYVEIIDDSKQKESFDKSKISYKQLKVKRYTDRKSDKAGRLKRSLVEELEVPSYCQLFNKCVLAICDCKNLREAV